MQPADDVNPYAPPTARVDEVDTPSGYAGFKRFSTWGVLLLLIVTLGIYLAYWLYTRGKRFNEVTNSEQFSMGLAKALVIVMCLSVAVDVFDNALPQGVPFFLYSVVYVAYLVLQVTCCFNFRRCLNEHDDIFDRQHPHWVGGLGTFFLHVLYLNYCLNQRIDAEAAGARPA